MKITKINGINYSNSLINQKIKSDFKQKYQENPYFEIPVDFKYGAQINFSGHYHKERKVPDVDFIQYKNMRETTKQFLRKRYKKYDKTEVFKTYVEKHYNKHDKNFLENLGVLYDEMPLKTPASVESFIEMTKLYAPFKDRQIICVGRSPKWFLDAALWMKDGIYNYDFAAFSGRWYRPDRTEGVLKILDAAPTAEEEIAYRSYLKDQGLDPFSIVKKAEKNGGKAIITDYICTSKGLTSFLDIMGRYAENQGVIKDFANSFELLTVGSLEYMDKLNNNIEELISVPEVIMPESIKPYNKPTNAWGGRTIKEKFYNIKNYYLFQGILLNPNTNECRSTYYPHKAWTVYRPDRFKTGFISDMDVVRAKLAEADKSKIIKFFDPVMSDYRNLLVFHILDEINARNLLKTALKR